MNSLCAHLIVPYEWMTVVFADLRNMSDLVLTVPVCSLCGGSLVNSHNATLEGGLEEGQNLQCTKVTGGGKGRHRPV